MNRIWHYTKDREFPTDEGDLLCYVNFNGYITVYYNEDGKYYGSESGDLIDVNDIEKWAYLVDVLERAGF